ncbi:MAG: putative protease Do-like 3, mitochondrial [Candidatus Angelobacter sp.]|nr:putative protease Do-like 3, mitochondrial [Candidatus Angelobacter sp.]
MPPLKQVVPQLRSALTQIIVRAKLSTGQPLETIAGTGFFVSGQRYIATAAHVIRSVEDLQKQGATNIQISTNLPMKDLHLPNVRSLMGFFGSPIEVVDLDQDNDLALLRTPKPIGPKGIHTVLEVEGKKVEMLEVSDVKFFAGTPEVGEEVAVAGFPLSIPYLIVQTGIISALPVFPVPGKNTEREEIVIDAAVNPGNSGGPVFMATSGLVIGVCRAQHLAPIVGTSAVGLSQNAGLSLITPVKFLTALMQKHGVQPRLR